MQTTANAVKPMNLATSLRGGRLRAWKDPASSPRPHSAMTDSTTKQRMYSTRASKATSIRPMQFQAKGN